MNFVPPSGGLDREKNYFEPERMGLHQYAFAYVYRAYVGHREALAVNRVPKPLISLARPTGIEPVFPP